MKQIKVYITAKREHAEKILKTIPDGIHCNARWLHMQHTGERPVTHWLSENFDDAAASNFVVFYVEPGDKLKTSLIEIGNALAFNKQIFIASDVTLVDKTTNMDDYIPHKDLVPWLAYQNIRLTGSLDQTFRHIKRVVHNHQEITKAGKVGV